MLPRGAGGGTGAGLLGGDVGKTEEAQEEEESLQRHRVARPGSLAHAVSSVANLSLHL